jgi:hypothetical protein
LRLVGTRHADAVPPAHDQIAKAKLVKRDRNLTGRRLLDREFVVAASKDLHKAIPGDHDPCAPVPPESSHRTKPRLQPAMIRLNPVVGIPIGAMPRRRQQLPSTIG